MDIEVKSPFPIEALPRIWGWTEPFRQKIADDFSPQTLGDFVSLMAQKLRYGRSWAVYGDGELGGLITYEGLTPWVGTAHFLLKPAFQRQGLAQKAARLAASEIFDEERIGKLVFYPLAGNVAIGSLLILLGAKREGTLVAHTLVNGKPTDMWVYGLTREGFENAASNYRSRDRGNLLNCRVRVIGPSEDADADQHQHTDLEPGHAEHDGDVGGHGAIVDLESVPGA